jgi:fungal STAND N-terminal Goodbye domain
MAAATYYSAEPMGDEASDLGEMWKQALAEYTAESGGKDLRPTNSSQWNMGRILADQEEQLQLFSVFRHDKGRVDKLRTLVSKNSAIIQSVASNIATAASGAFPPSAAILTAFNCVMNASKAVSDDYDMIVQFFDIVNSFLERVSMLEDRIPDMRPFQLHLMKVFKSLLVLCAIARKYRTGQGGRLKKWAKALVDGSDGKLKGAFDGMHTQLQRFESATQIATLRTAIDTSRKLDTYGKDLKTIQTGVNQTIELGFQGVAVGQQNLAQGQQILAMEEVTYSMAMAGKGFAQDAAMSSKEILEVVTLTQSAESEQIDMMKRIENKLGRNMKSQQPKNKLAGDQTIDAGERKSGALKNLEAKLRDDTKSQLTDLESNYVPGTFGWFLKTKTYQDLEAGISQIVHLTGPPGIGKSMITYATARALKDQFDDGSETSVAFFFFRADDDDEARSAVSMLKSCAYQVAAHNVKYREELNAELRRDETRWRNEKSNPKALFRRLFTSKFTTPSRRVILLLDGVDEAEDDAIKQIIAIIKKAPKTEANIQIMFSTDAAVSDALGFRQVKATKFTIDKKMVLDDMKLVALTRMKRLSRLSKLRQSTRKKIARKLCKKADSTYSLLFLTAEAYFVISLESLWLTENLFLPTIESVNPL